MTSAGRAAGRVGTDLERSAQQGGRGERQHPLLACPLRATLDSALVTTHTHVHSSHSTDRPRTSHTMGLIDKIVHPIKASEQAAENSK